MFMFIRIDQKAVSLSVFIPLYFSLPPSAWYTNKASYLAEIFLIFLSLKMNGRIKASKTS
jgi:hypothetical protein